MHHYRLPRQLDIPCRRNHSIFPSNIINRRSRYHHFWSVTTTWWRFWTVTTAAARGRSHHRIMSTAAYAHAAVSPQKIAIGQVCSTSSKWNNLVQIAQCAGWAASSSCAMLFLPECCGFLGTSAPDTLRNAEPSLAVVTPNPTAVQTTLAQIVRDCCGSAAATNTNPVPTYDDLAMQPPTPEWELSIVDGLRIIAQTSQLWISAGSVHVLCPDDDDTTNDPIQRVYNTHIIMDPTGMIRSEYRKIHLFDVCLPQQNVDLRESRTTRPGTELVVCRDSPIGCLGVTVCYDLRFPEMFTQLVQTMGAQVLLVPSAFTVPTGKAHWHTLLRGTAGTFGFIPDEPLYDTQLTSLSSPLFLFVNIYMYCDAIRKKPGPLKINVT
jgi:predicted amidohydrolase